MSMVHVEVSRNALDHATRLLAGLPGGIEKALASAAKRAGTSAKTKAGQYAAAEYTITKSTFMGKTDVKSKSSASGGGAGMTIVFRGAVIPLIEFNTRYSRGGSVQTQVKRSGSAAILQHVFVNTIFGKLGAFERLGSKRFPVEQKYGPSTAHMMQNEKVIEQMDKQIKETFEKRLDHEVMRILNGWGG